MLSSILTFLDRTQRYLSKYDACHEICFVTCRSLVCPNEIDNAVKMCFPSNLGKKLLSMALRYAKNYISFQSSLSPSIVTNGCTCIRILVVESENRACFTELQDGPCILVECVQFLSERPLQVEHALLALGNAVFDSSEGKKQVRTSDGLQIVLDIMNRYYYVASVAEACLLAVQGICKQDESSGKLATSLRAHNACVKAMVSLRDDPAIQERALAAILSLGIDCGAVAEMRASSVLELATSAAAAFPFSKILTAQKHQISELVKGNDSQVRNPFDRLEKLKFSPLRAWKSLTR